jgi:hypothetical protein
MMRNLKSFAYFREEEFKKVHAAVGPGKNLDLHKEDS